MKRGKVYYGWTVCTAVRYFGFYQIQGKKSSSFQFKSPLSCPFLTHRKYFLVFALFFFLFFFFVCLFVCFFWGLGCCFFFFFFFCFLCFFVLFCVFGFVVFVCLFVSLFGFFLLLLVLDQSMIDTITHTPYTNRD